MNRVLLLTVTLAVFHSQVHAQQDYCYGKDSEKLQTRQYGTKTAYEVVKGTNYGRQYIVPKCKPTRTWLLSRHGTRLPTRSTIEKMPDLILIRDEIVQNYKVRRSIPDSGALCMEDLFTIQTWKLNTSITTDQAGMLTSQGWHDLKFLAKNYQSIFPDILQNRYSESKFLFRHTNTSRTKDSFRAFADGLFGSGSDAFIRTEPVVGNDTLLKSYAYCPLWNKANDDLKNNDSEIMKFENSDLVKNTFANISSRLGFKYTLETKQINLMWDMCRYEQAWHVDRSSSWCAAFTPEQVSVLEYREDLKYYYESGYGLEINSRLPCAAVKDMLMRLESTEGPNSVAYFTHSTMVQTFLVALGAMKDNQPLTADGYNTMKDRKWKISLGGPFASNLMAVRYECPEETKSSKVMFFLNQNPIDLSWCKVGLCDWDDVKANYKMYSDAECDSFYCSSGSPAFSISSFVLVLNVFVYVFLHN